MRLSLQGSGFGDVKARDRCDVLHSEAMVVSNFASFSLLVIFQL